VLEVLGEERLQGCLFPNLSLCDLLRKCFPLNPVFTNISQDSRNSDTDFTLNSNFASEKYLFA
jgi:hypothetical protein